jgi:hypothetical protein
MGSNGSPDSDPAVNQPESNTQDHSTEQSRSDPPPTTQPNPPNPTDTSNMNDPPARPDQPTPRTSNEATKEVLPDDESPAAPTEDAHTNISHTESLEPKFSTAIGPSSDHHDPSTKDSDDSGPTLVITLLLTTGARHPFKIDGKYLRKRAVNVDNNDPFSLSVYTLKELIWREWRPGRFIDAQSGTLAPVP